MKILSNIIVYLLIAVIIWQGYELWKITKRLDKKLKSEIKVIDSKIKAIDSTTYQIKIKIAQARENDVKQRRKINYLLGKLKKYEKKTDFSHISNDKDSIRKLLTE